MRVFIASILLLTSASPAAAAPSAAELSKSTAELQKQAVDKLGVGLRSIGLLLLANPHGMANKTSLVKNGDWSLLERLERKGLVKLTSAAAPEGPPEELWVTISLTPLGEAIASSARNEQPN